MVTTAAPNRWWILPAVLVGLVVVAWLVLAGLPFGGDRREGPRVQPRAAETVTEAPPPAASATILDAPAPSPQPATITELPPAAAPAPAPAPAKKQPAKQPAPERTDSAEITGAEAEATLRQYITSSNYYRIGAECVRVNNGGYKNEGFTFEVWDGCDAGGGSRMLGRWRVDSKTRALYRQRDDGRYLRP